MRKGKRSQFVAVSWLFGLMLLLVLFVAFQVSPVSSQGEDETALEQSKAYAAESGANQNPAGPMLGYVSAITYPLVAGVDDTAIGAYEIDPVTNASNQLFSGAEAWGLAYVPISDVVYIASGSSLYMWPASGGPPILVGTIQDPAGTTLSMVALAYYNGQLWSTRNIGTEGLYNIDPATAVATFVAPYSVPTADIDIGGLGFDPSGTLYGTNDDTSFPGGGRGLVEIALDGTVTYVSPYPAGETDIDGLAVSDDGRAFLIEDEPGPSIHIYDFATNSYIGTLNTPWATAEIFSAGTWVPQGPPAVPGIAMTKTVGMDSATCAASSTLDVPTGGGGTDVYYCYTVMNTGNVTLPIHDLVDSELGTIFTNFNYDLGPGASVDTVAAGLVISTLITQTTTNVATWTAYLDTATFTTSVSSATVTVLPPTSVGLSGFGDEATTFSPLLLVAILALVVGFGYAIRRKFAA